MSAWIRALAVAGTLCLATASASAQVPAAGLPGTPYELRADFAATLALMIGSLQHTATSQGEVLDRLGTNGEHQITVSVRAVQVPLLLRPFKGSIASVTSELISSQAEDPRTFAGYDLAVLETRDDGTSVLGGVRADIVDEAVRRLPPSASSSSPELRRALAKALLTSPSMREGLRRSGPPYAFRAVADAAGRLLESAVLYDWGSAEKVWSNADGWLTYPDVRERWRMVSCREWGCTARGYLNWWFSHLPRQSGKTDGVLNNWWAYVRDPMLAASRKSA